jgi:hypothetical protein
MINELFCYMSDYLPDDIHKIAALPPTEQYPPTPPSSAQSNDKLSVRLKKGTNPPSKPTKPTPSATDEKASNVKRHLTL